MTDPDVPFPHHPKPIADIEAACQDCPFPMSDDKMGEHIFPVSIKSVPERVGDLVGRLCRVIRPGDQVTFDYNPNRVNIYLDDRSRIRDVRFG